MLICRLVQKNRAKFRHGWDFDLADVRATQRVCFLSSVSIEIIEKSIDFMRFSLA